MPARAWPERNGLPKKSISLVNKLWFVAERRLNLARPFRGCVRTRAVIRF
jgi:hypothetical protein